MKPLLKGVVLALGLIIVSPLAVAERIARRVMKRDVWLDAQGEALALFPGKLGSALRNAYYRLVLAQCPLDCRICFGTVISKSSARIGHRVYVGLRCLIGLATIGDDTMLADHVQLLSGAHQHGTFDRDKPFQQQPRSFTRVRIGRNTWIGSGAVVMADVGENCIIGAGSVVTRPIPDDSVAAGNPARVIRSTLPGENRLAGVESWRGA